MDRAGRHGSSNEPDKLQSLINASETCFLDAEYNWLAAHKVTVAVSPRLNHLLGSTTPLEQTKLAFTPFTAVPAGYHCQLLAHHCPLMVQECTQRAHRWPVKSVPLWSSLGVTGRSCLRRLNFPDLAFWQIGVELYFGHGKPSPPTWSNVRQCFTQAGRATIRGDLTPDPLDHRYPDSHGLSRFVTDCPTLFMSRPLICPRQRVRNAIVGPVDSTLHGTLRRVSWKEHLLWV